MKRRALTQDEIERNRLEEADRNLCLRAKILTEKQRTLALERAEQASTMPPSDVIQAIEQRKKRGGWVTRKQAETLWLEQLYSLAILVLLLIAICGLIWWALKSMRGG